MKPTHRRALRIPSKLVFTTLGCAVLGALACGGGPTQSGADASAQDARPDGCIYQDCSGPNNSPSCPGIICLVPPEACPVGCEPIIV